ncbi:unnamed protein product [Calypogeia fissa]
MGAKSSTHGKAAESSKITKRMVEAMAERAKRGQSTIKTFNSIILKFPKIDEAFEAVKTVFKKFDVDRSGTIDLGELRTCFEELQVNFTEEEVREYYEESDLDGSQGIDFKEFIVLLALVYLLGEPIEGSSHKAQHSKIGLPQLEATFDTIVQAFVFFDANGDGYISKEEIIQSINQIYPSQIYPSRSADRLGLERFEEMDWDHNGLVTFKEFLFAFTDWVGLEE